MSTLTAEELRTLFLFEALDDAQLAWLTEHGYVEEHEPGVVYAEGDPATCFYVLLSGTISLRRRVGPDDVELVRTEQVGVYSGATQAYLGDASAQRYITSVTAVTPCRFFVLPAAEFGAVLRAWFPMALHLLEGLILGQRNSQQILGQRERLVALGSLTAGLTHELNNPAAAAVRATASLRERVAGMRHKLGMIADGKLPPQSMHELVALQEEAVERATKGARDLSPMERADREDAMAEWLEDHGVTGAYDLAPLFVAGGLDPDWAETVAARVPDDRMLEGAMRWIAYTVETESLMREIEDSIGRISSLLGAAKQYSQMDRAPFQPLDVHAGIDSTLVMMTTKLKGIRVVKDYASGLPEIPGYAAELNQVWTNLVDNAAAAMGGDGELVIRTARAGEDIVVEVQDSGPGIPDDVRGRVFEPFFTTKPIGEGTGLGLDISWRIVVNRHHGDLQVRSRPGETVFTVRLPVTPPPDA